MAAQWQLHHLLQWLHQFNLDSPQPDAASLSDSVTVAKVLNLIDPPWFNAAWLSKIKENVASNKILKVSNWKKVLERLVDYYEVHLGQRLSGFTMPDVSKIGESEDEAELCRLLQLVLGCAVHCERQEEFIQAILQMEEDVQRGIMAAIQGLPGIEELAGGSLVPNADSLAVMAGRSPSQTTGMGFHNLMAQLEAANEEKKLLAKERQKLNLQISTLQDEIQHLQAEVESLRSGGVPLESLDRSDGGNPSALMQKREIVRLTEELMRSDSAREEVRLRCEALEQDLARLRMRQDDLQSAAEQTRSLKDEVDILRERSARLENAQSTIDSMRRKVEEGNELKRQLRKLEEKNSQYIQQNMELEEELKKLGPWKSQLELQKKQIAEVQAALDDERRRADKFELQFKNVVERNEALTLEKERLVTERDKLIELNEEFKFAQLNNGAMMPQEGSPSTTGVDTLDMIPPEIREKLLRLQHENRLLKEKKDGGQDEAEVLQTVNAGLLERIGRLEAENRCTCRVSQQRKSLVECQVKPLVPSGSIVASIKAKLASKPVFAGSLMAKNAVTNSSQTLHGSSSCSQLSSYNRLTTSGAPNESAPIESKVTVSRVERLKDAFLNSDGSSCNQVVPQLSTPSRVFSRSVSYGYDRALGFGIAAATSSQDRKWGSSESETRQLETSLPLSGGLGDRSSLLRLATLPHRRESDPALSKMEVNGYHQAQSHQPPPPPVEAVVITRDSSPRDETDSGYRGGDSIHYEESTSSPRYSPNSSHFDDGIMIDFNALPYKKDVGGSGAGLLRSPPDDSIEIDVSFHDGRASFDCESVSSFSIISETIVSSDRSFDRSQSLLLTPRSSAHRNSDDTSSRKSFGKSLKKRKMFKAAANAMFSLCGP
ncbi:protein Hook homolog 3-like isoform X1 [Daphnia carinata]|uniref:protein Hook homolog 3-like isoform X1 n=1 Tax=Daphnia carinata TaxID=120202 RepID=UPI002579AC79|nr:protein Hook homolog 3-like isoform X1 [Daphnia carinata]